MQSIHTASGRKFTFWFRAIRSLSIASAIIVAMMLGLYFGHFFMAAIYGWFEYSPSYMAASIEGSASDALQSHFKAQLIPASGFVVLMIYLLLGKGFPQGARGKS